MSELEFQFTAKVDELDFGRMAYHVVYVPSKVLKLLPIEAHPRLRINGLVAGKPFHGAIQPAGRKKYYLMLSRKFCKAAKIQLGDRIDVVFGVADQDAVEVPRELEFALQANPRAMKIWEQITPGKKRGFAHRVASAKRAETRENRIEEVFELLFELEKNKR